MKRKTAGRVAKPKICALCKGPIAEKRPLWLLTLAHGAIVGPYHAGCASRLSMEYAKAENRKPVDLPDTSKYGQMAREETLPW